MERMTRPYVEMGRKFAWDGDFLTPAAHKFTGMERYPWLMRLCCGLILKLVVNRKFDQYAQDWGCDTRLDERVYHDS